MRNPIADSACALLCVLLALQAADAGSRPSNHTTGPSAVAQHSSSWRVFWPNNIRTAVNNNGVIFADSGWQSSYEGLFWPGSTNKNLIYSAGLWVSGRDELGKLRTALSYYASYYQPGRINGTFADTNYSAADSPGDPRFKILMVSDTSTPADPDYARWISDAAVTGAPLDKGGMPLRMGKVNAYWLMNDLDTTSMRLLLKHDPRPMGLEISNYFFAFDDGGTLSNTIYLVMDVKNKSVHTYSSLYLGLFNDIDLGFSLGNYPGCDSTLSLGYMYSGIDSDWVYGRQQPACGFVVLESPAGTSLGSPMNSFMKDLGGQIPPKYMLPYNPANDSEFAFVLQGRLIDGSPISPPGDPGNIITKVNPGDPYTHTGWLASDDFPPTDVRNLVGSGPCVLSPGTSVRFALAFIVAQDTGRLSSVRKLKDAVPEVVAKWNTLTDVKSPGKNVATPKSYRLDQNYPNPFNPSTTIKYELTKTSQVNLSVYDVLGREVSVLVNERREAGVHDITFDGSSLASGVYLYRLTAGSFVQTRKLLLLK